MSLDDRINRYADKLRAMSYADLPTIPGEDIVRDLLERTTLWADIITQRYVSYAFLFLICCPSPTYMKATLRGNGPN